MKIIAFSDVHGQYSDIKIPECDVLIFAGDFSWASGFASSAHFFRWFKNQPGTHKLMIPGNHDYEISLVNQFGVTVLINREVVIDGLRFFGSPYTPEFNGWNYMREPEELETMYKKFPEDVDILITHGPALGILDGFRGERIGCEHLLNYVRKAQPKVHIFGHNHEQGFQDHRHTKFYNVSMLNQDYKKVYPLTEINI